MGSVNQVEGLDDVIKSLRGLEPKIKLKFVKNAAKAGAMLIKNKAKANAPKGKTGALKRGLGVKQMKARPNIIGSMVIVRHGKARTKGQVKKNDDPFYWRFQEFGFYKKAGLHFIEKAYDSMKNRTVKAMEQKIASDIGKYRGN